MGSSNCGYKTHGYRVTICTPSQEALTPTYKTHEPPSAAGRSRSAPGAHERGRLSAGPEFTNLSLCFGIYVLGFICEGWVSGLWFGRCCLVRGFGFGFPAVRGELASFGDSTGRITEIHFPTAPTDARKPQL